MDTITKGNAAEAKVLSALVERNLSVLIPFGGGHPYDLMIDLGRTATLRVQCKCARPVGGCLSFNTHATDHGQGPTPYIGLADVFGVYFPPLTSVYLVPVQSVGLSQGRLRLEPTLNNQRRRVRLAADYEIDRWTPEDLISLATQGNISPPGHRLAAA